MPDFGSFEKTIKILGDQRVGVHLSPSVQKQFQIPVRSDLYLIKKFGRVSLPESLEQIFVTGYSRAFSHNVYRDYRDLHRMVAAKGTHRGYLFSWDPKRPNRTCKNLWKTVSSTRSKSLLEQEFAARLYTDVFIAAVLTCPITDKDIFV